MSRRTLTGIALAVALAVLPTRGAASGSPPDDPLGGWRHGLAGSWVGDTFWSKAGSHYTIHSAAVSYLFSTARSGFFANVNVLFPLQVRQDGSSWATSGVYSPAVGLDLLLGWEWRFGVGPGLELEVGPGLHVGLVTLNGNAQYVSFSTAPVGVGGASVLRWRPGWTIGDVPLSLGATGAFTLDFFDPLHSEDLSIGLSMRLGLVVGLDWN